MYYIHKSFPVNHIGDTMNKLLLLTFASSTLLSGLCFADSPIQIENAQRAIDKAYEQIEDANEKLENQTMSD